MQYKLLVKKISVSADKKIKQKEYLPIGKLPIIDQGKQLIGGYSDDISKQVSCNLPVIIFGDHTKNVKLIPFQFAAGADGIKVLEPKTNISPKYLYYGTLYLTFRIEDKGYARHYQHIEKQDLPVPPLSEQERIVARIEELFSELDKSVETLKKTKEQLVVYRQAVLKEAFDSIPKSQYVLLRTLMIGTPQNGLYKPKSAYGNGTRILRVDGFYNGFIVNDYDYKSLALTNEEIDKYSLKIGDLVVNRVNSMSHLGKCALVRQLNETTVFESNIMRIQLNEELVNLEYIVYYLSSLAGKKALTKNAKQAVNQASINQTDVGNTLVPVPNLKIQISQLRVIESRLSICDSIEKTVDTALQEAESLRQSILKEAFEGGI